MNLQIIPLQYAESWNQYKLAHIQVCLSVLIGNYGVIRCCRRSERKPSGVTLVKSQIKKSMAKVDHGVYQKKIQRQKRARASGERGIMTGWGLGQKGMLLRGAGGGRDQGARKDCIALIRYSPETLKDA